MIKSVAACVTFLALFVGTRPQAQANEPRALFAQAYFFFGQNRLAEAESLFLTTLRDDYLLADYSLYFLARIALDRGAPERARQYLTTLKERFPDSVWLAEAHLRLARTALAAKDPGQALQDLEPVVDLKGRDEIACEARFLRAQLHELQGRHAQAHVLYQELRRTIPLCSWALAARKETRRLEQQDPKLSPRSYERSWEESELLLRQRQYREAEDAFRKLLDAFPDEGLRPRFLYGLARTYAAQGKRAEESPLLSVIVNKYPQSSEAAPALNRLARIYWNADENAKALAHFNRLLERYPDSSFADSAHIAVARIHWSLAQPQQTTRMLREFPRRFPNSLLRAEAQWRLAWIYYLQNNYQRAYATFQNLAADAGAERYKTGALYWKGRTAEKTQRQEEAKNIYLMLVRQYDESFYAGAARRRLEGLGKADEPTSVASVTADPPLAPTPRFSFHLARARELTELSLPALAVAELDEIRQETADPGSTLTLVREYARLGAYHRSVPIAGQIAQTSAEIRMHRYPLVYWDLVKQKAEDRGLDPYLVVALMRQESLFDARAVSPANAIGLMQLLPSTAARLAKQLGMGVLAAYNAGEKALARWERQILTDDPDEFIERITYGETLQYVKLVLRSHRLYRTLYGGQQ
jgi:soluble lytic murein transglycosylase